jgi:ribosome biogenesis protein SSF1/2
MTLELVKIEDGLCDGEVLYHTYISKTSEEIAELRKRNIEKKRLKEERKREQEENVQRKEDEKKKTQKSSLKEDEEEKIDQPLSDDDE